MKLKSIIALSLVALLTLFACQKEIVSIPDSNEPIFYLSGTVGQDSLTSTAGEGALMKTEIKQINGVPFYSGKLSTENESLEIGFYGGNIDFKDSQSKNLLELSKVDYAIKSTTPLFALEKEFFDDISDIQYIRWFVDGQFFGLNELKLFNPGRYDVCGEFIYQDGSIERVCNQLIIGYKKNKIFNIKNFNIVDSDLILWVDGNTSDLEKVEWFVGEELIGSGENISFTHQTGFNHINSRVKYKNGIYRERNIAVNKEFPGRTINDFGVLENSSSYAQDYKVKLTYTKEGKTYVSDLSANQLNQFNIHQLSTYQSNAKGAITLKLDFDLAAKLISKTSSNSIQLNLKGTWAIPLN